MNYKDYSNRILSRFMPNKTWKQHCYREKYRQIQKSDLASLLIKNQKLQDIHKDDKCFILGNGPSLSKVNFSLLRNQITFTTNELYYHENFQELDTTYHLFADPFYVKELDTKIDLLLSKSKPKGIFLESSAYKKVLENAYHTKLPIYIFINGMEVEDLKYIPIDLCKMLPYFCSVVQCAIVIAAYMGFKEIYLLGCDCTGIVNYINKKKGQSMMEYSFSLPEEEQKKQQCIQINSEHMFFEWYHIFKSYRLLNETLMNRKIKIINLTENGILDSLEKGNLEDVILS